MILTRHNSWNQFRHGYFEVVALIDHAKLASNIPDYRRNISPQQTLLRAAVLLLCSHVEVFFKSLIEEYLDDLEEQWELLTPGMKRYVILQAREYVLEEVPKDQYLTCSAPNEVDGLYGIFKEVNGWIESPKVLSTSPRRKKLEYFYRGTAPKAIEKTLTSMRQDGCSFFGWVDKKGLDRGRFWTVLDALVEIRNGIAHEAGSISLTINDVRLYLAIATSIIRQALLFIEE
jgi:hypothetical protein